MADFGLNLKLVLCFQSQYLTESLGFLNPPLLQAAKCYAQPLNHDMKKYLLMLFVLLVSCGRSLCAKFNSDAKDFGEEFKSMNKKYIEDNADKLTDKKMVSGMDSIAKMYFVDKNVILIKRYPECVKAISTLNYIKDKISKEELKLLLKTIPKEFKTDSNYVFVEKFLKN